MQKIKSFFVYILYFDQKKPMLYRWFKLLFVIVVLFSLSSVNERIDNAVDNAVDGAYTHADEIADNLNYRIDEIIDSLNRR